MCVYDYDWTGDYVHRTLDSDVRCDCGRVIPAGTVHRACIEVLEESDCLICNGSAENAIVDDYGHEVLRGRGDVARWRALHDLDVLTWWTLDTLGPDFRPCPAPGCEDGYGSELHRAPEEAVQCELCEIGSAWLNHHCDGMYSANDIPAQVVEHDAELDWPSYQDRAVIAAARRNWRGYDASCLRGLVRVATAKKVA